LPCSLLITSPLIYLDDIGGMVWLLLLMRVLEIRHYPPLTIEVIDLI
jgi:hypothetical protein